MILHNLNWSTLGYVVLREAYLRLKVDRDAQRDIWYANLC